MPILELIQGDSSKTQVSVGVEFDIQENLYIF